MKKIYKLIILVALILASAGIGFFYFMMPSPTPRPMPRVVPKGLPAVVPAPGVAARQSPSVAPKNSSLLLADMGQNGVELQAGGGKYFFDTNEDLLAEDIDWVLPQTAILLKNCAANQPISSFEEIKNYDSNADGIVDMNDKAFLDILLWSDTNQDARCTEDEIKLLPDAKITAIIPNVTKQEAPQKKENVTLTKIGSLEADKNFDLYAASFTALSPQTRYTGSKVVSEDVAILPNLQGMGLLLDLHYAAMADEGLKTLLQSLKNLTPQDAPQFMSLYTQMIERWGKVDNIPQQEKKAGLPHRKLALLARVSGISEDAWLQKNKNTQKINEIYDEFYYSTAQAILAQTLMNISLPLYAVPNQKPVKDDDLKNIFAQALTLNAMNDPLLLTQIYEVLQTSLQKREYNQQIYNENMTALFSYNNLVYMRQTLEKQNYVKGYDKLPLPAGKSGIFTNNPENNVFNGGVGNDIYYYHKGDGRDIINEKGGINHIIMPDINFAELDFKDDGLDLQIMLKSNMQNGLIIKNYFADPQYKVDSIDFNNGSLLKLNTVDENILSSIWTRLHMWYLKTKL